MKPSTVITLVLLLFAAALLAAMPFAAQVGAGAYSGDAPTTINHNHQPLPPAFSPPLIHHASVHPDKVLPGDLMTVTVAVSSGTDIISVTADMGGIETISLRLLEGSAHNGTWQANWLVHDTEFRAYVTTVTATNSTGESSSYDVNWSDDPGWYHANWTYRKPITIDHDKVNSTLPNFPVLINLAADSDLAAKAQDNGDDILFTPSDGTTKLAHEIDLFNGSTGELIAWINVTSLSNSADTTLYMYYNNSGCGSQQDPTNVWETNYKAVWHLLGNATTTLPESTSNSNTGTKKAIGEPLNTTSGQIDGAQEFDGTDASLSSEFQHFHFSANFENFENEVLS